MCIRDRIAPLHLSSSGKGKDVATKQGNRRLQATIYFLEMCIRDRYDSARELTEMASMQFAAYGLRNPYTYQRPKITPQPNETGLTVPGGTGVAVVPNGTAPALKQPYLPGQYTEYPAACLLYTSNGDGENLVTIKSLDMTR